jgi:hypothetical protein
MESKEASESEIADISQADYGRKEMTMAEIEMPGNQIPNLISLKLC